jgi:hypothetical protein
MRTLGILGLAGAAAVLDRCSGRLARIPFADSFRRNCRRCDRESVPTQAEVRTMKRPVESLQDFKTRIAAIVGDKRGTHHRRSPTKPAVGAQEASDQNAETAAAMKGASNGEGSAVIY